MVTGLIGLKLGSYCNTSSSNNTTHQNLIGIEREKKEKINSNEVMLLRPYLHSITSELFFLRPLFPEDYTSLLPIFTNAQVMKYFGNGSTIEPETVKQQIESGSKNNFQLHPQIFHWALIHHEGCVGRISVILPSHEHPESSEIFYCIIPSQNGRKLTTSATYKVIEYCGGNFFATAHPNNLASQAVLKKIGFSPDPTRQNVEKYGSFRHYYILNTSNEYRFTNN